jgi:hypothetical protein
MEVETSVGPIEYADTGGDGPVLVSNLLGHWVAINGP